MLGLKHSLSSFLDNANVGDEKVRALWGKEGESVPKRWMGNCEIILKYMNVLPWF